MKLFTIPITLGIVTAAFAQQPATFASGLTNPIKIILGPAGTLLAGETGTDKNSGRVSVISSSGVRRTLIDGLPSGLSGTDPDGVTGLLLDGNTLFVAVGEGDMFTNGPTPGTTIIAPRFPASPILSSVLQVNLSKAVDQINTPFTLKTTDHTPLLDGNVVTLANSDGDSAAVTLLAQFPPRPDPNALWKNSHPFGLAKLPNDPTHLYLNNAGLNLVTRIDIQTGKAKTVSSFGPFPNFGSPNPPPVVDAVPTSVRPYGNQLLVTFLTGFPFSPGDAKVLVLDPATGKSEPFISWVNSTMDIVWRPRGTGERPQFWTLEFSTNQLAGVPGRLLRFDSAESTVVASGLVTPTSLALDEANGKLYISTRADGKILVVDVGK